MHRPWWKVMINTPLRWMQRGRQYRWLIFSVFDNDGNLVGYGFGPVFHQPGDWV